VGEDRTVTRRALQSPTATLRLSCCKAGFRALERSLCDRLGAFPDLSSRS